MHPNMLVLGQLSCTVLASACVVCDFDPVLLPPAFGPWEKTTFFLRRRFDLDSFLYDIHKVVWHAEVQNEVHRSGKFMHSCRRSSISSIRIVQKRRVMIQVAVNFQFALHHTGFFCGVSTVHRAASSIIQSNQFPLNFFKLFEIARSSVVRHRGLGSCDTTRDPTKTGTRCKA